MKLSIPISKTNSNNFINISFLHRYKFKLVQLMKKLT